MALEPLYITDQIVNKDGTITERFRLLWQQLITGSVQVAAAITVSFLDQFAALAVSTLLTVTVAGPYRVSYYLRKTIPDGVSSSAQVTLSWTDQGAACSRTFTALTTDTGTATAGDIVLLRVDANAPIEASVAYASNTPGVMHYDAVFTVEQVVGAVEG